VKDLESGRFVGVCGTRMLRKKIYKGETGRRLVDRFREHLRDIEKNNTDASKPVAPHFNLPNHSHHNMTTTISSIDKSKFLFLSFQDYCP